MQTPTPTPTPTPTCPPQTSTPASVTFSVQLKEEQPLQWHMLCGGQDYAPGNYPTLNVPYDNQATFNFAIAQGQNFAANPIGVLGGANKPPHAGVGNGQINITTQTATALSFTDSNNLKGNNQLNYVLYFTDSSKLDPIIQNGGCCGVGGGQGGGFFQSEAFTIAMIVLAVLVIGYIGYRLFGAKRTGA